MSSATLYLFLRLNNSETFVELVGAKPLHLLSQTVLPLKSPTGAFIASQTRSMCFERSGRGQEPSRGHKFSILENFLSIRDFTSAMRPHFRSDLVGACLPQTLLRTDEEELCQFDAIPPTYREKQSVPDGERPIVHIAIVCGLWQGASYSGTHPVFILSLHRLFEIPPSASRIRIVSRF